jgi:hypothetical protein
MTDVENLQPIEVLFSLLLFSSHLVLDAIRQL